MSEFFPESKAAAGTSRIGSGNDGPPIDPTLVQTLRTSGAGRLVFGRFRLVRELGRGGMGVVWLAQDERLGLEIALKFLPGLVVEDPDALHDLRREITRGLRLTHPGIVRVYDLHEDSTEGLAAIAMEYVAGPTLTDEKARQPDRCFDAAAILPWVLQLCEVLAYVHEEVKIVHRDLKPRNLMLTAGGKLKVTDFGIAATISDSHSRLTMASSSGTPAYMSPQQAVGHRPLAADDIYAVGATIYELLTSKPPFFRGNMVTILHQVSTELPMRMEERRAELEIFGRAPIPVEWEETVAACLEKEPGRRPASMREVAERICGSWPGGPAADSNTSESAEVSEECALSDGVTIPTPTRFSAGPPALSEQTAHPENFSNQLPEPSGAAVIADARSNGRPVLIAVLVLLIGLGAAVARWHFHGLKSGGTTSELANAAAPAAPIKPNPAPATPAAAPRALSIPFLPEHATKEVPFVNSLGMEFVPVLGTKVLFCRTDTRVKDFRAYAEETHYEQTGGVYVTKVKSDGKGVHSIAWEGDPNASWEHPGFQQTGDHPVVGVNWHEAKAFCDWLSSKEGHAYRLPTDDEWSAAVGLAKYPWGNRWPPPSGAGNFADDAFVRSLPIGDWKRIPGIDGYPRTSPVGRFSENQFGLFDMSGNVCQWCEDVYKANMNEPAVVKAFPDLVKEASLNGIPFRVSRGSSWISSAELLMRSSYRIGHRPLGRNDCDGFRCVLAVSGR